MSLGQRNVEFMVHKSTERTLDRNPCAHLPGPSKDSSLTLAGHSHESTPPVVVETRDFDYEDEDPVPGV